MFKVASIEKTPLLLRWIKTTQLLLFILPVITLFYQFKGVSIGDFFLIQGIFAFATFILEVPTGYLGDIFSRKKILVLSYFVWFLGYLSLSFLDGLTSIVIGEILLGFSVALHSGTSEAYLYDILKKQSREKEVIKEEGKINAYSKYGTAFATFTGGLVYHYLGFDNAILFETSFMLIAFILSLFLPEIPEVKRIVEKGKSKWKDILDISKYAIHHPEIKWIMLFPAVFGSATLMLMWGQQPLMEHNLVPVALFGVFVGINQLLRAFFSQYSQWLFHTFKTKGFTLLLYGILSMGLFSACIIPSLQNTSATYSLLIIVGLAAASQASLGVVINSMINHRIKSDERATILSVKSMAGTLANGIIMILMKFLIDSVGLQATLGIMTPLLLFLIFLSLRKLVRLNI